MTLSPGKDQFADRLRPGKTHRFIRFCVVPAAVYLLVFVVVTYPLILRFSSHFFTDDKDGLVMIWNVWWTNTAVTQLHQSPWHTSYLYFPHGVSLLAHTLCPFNGFLATALLPFLTLTQTYNSIVILTFVIAGLTTFWLTYYVVGSYVPSVIAGFIFSFSNYHFAHTPGHLNLASLEWIPLFVLCWYVLVENPGVLIALASALSLFAVILCDYNYLFYCGIIAAALLIWRALRTKDAFFFLKKRYIVSISIFFLAAISSSGVIVFKLLGLVRSGSLYGGHDPSEFSTDLLSPFLYGSFLRFSHLTEGFWSTLPGNTSEKSVYMGISVVILVVYTWVRRRDIKIPSLRLWYALLLFFLLMSLGPVLQVGGQNMPLRLTPYRLLELVVPWLEISGMPARMMVIAMLCSAVIGAAGLDSLLRGSGKVRLAAAALVVLLFVEYLPQRMPTFEGIVPDWVIVLKDLPDGGGVIDARGDPYKAMYYQTVHKKPIWGGVVARVPESLMVWNERINELVAERDTDRLRDEYRFRYAVTGSGEIYDLERGRVVYQP